ncbi:hypothetical protein KZK20_002292 [Salmonella enterica]|nr:hypothetical protein [Salmonella enterica]
MTEYPEDDPVYGTYEREETLTVCTSSTISGAVEKLLRLSETNSWPVRDDEGDYYDFDLGHDCGPLSFSPRFAEIVDRDNCRALCGEFTDELTWFSPLTSPQDVVVLKAQQNALYEDASYEVAQDNYSTARRLRARAKRLGLFLVDKHYEGLSEVRDLATYCYDRNNVHSLR